MFALWYTDADWELRQNKDEAIQFNGMKSEGWEKNRIGRLEIFMFANKKQLISIDFSSTAYFIVFNVGWNFNLAKCFNLHMNLFGNFFSILNVQPRIDVCLCRKNYQPKKETNNFSLKTKRAAIALVGNSLHCRIIY